MTCSSLCAFLKNGYCEKYSKELEKCKADWNKGLYEKHIFCELERKNKLIKGAESNGRF